MILLLVRAHMTMTLDCFVGGFCVETMLKIVKKPVASRLDVESYFFINPRQRPVDERVSRTIQRTLEKVTKCQYAIL